MTNRRKSSFVIGLAVLLALAAAACFILRRAHVFPSPVIRHSSVPTAGLDPAVAALIESTLKEARRSPRSGAAWGKLGSVLMHYEFVEEARRAFDEAERLSPTEARWPYLHGVMLMPYDAEAAIAKLKRAVELAPAQPDMPRFRLAEFLAERGRTNEALTHFQMLLRLHPEHPLALLGLARLSHQKSREGESASFLGRCLTNAHTTKSAHVLLAAVERALGNSAAADAAALRSAALPADQPWPDPYWDEAAAYRVGRKAMIEKAAALMDQGGIPEALAVLAGVTRQYPADDEAWYLMGWALNQQREPAEAERALREHLRRSPDSPKGHAQLAVALLHQKRYREAIEVLETALKLKSTWRELHFNLGYACAQLGRTNDAIRHLRNALAHDPGYAPTYNALADLLNRRGEKDEARRLLEQARDLAPGDR